MRLKPVLTSKYILQKRRSLIEICMSKPANDLGLIIRKVSVSAAVTVRINVKNTALLDFVLSKRSHHQSIYLVC